MTIDREKRIKSIVELDPNDLDKVVGGISGGKTTPGIQNRAEEKKKFSDEPSNEPKAFKSSEQASKGA